MGRDQVAVCPRCGCPDDAVEVTYHLGPSDAAQLSRMVAIVRRELGLGSDGAAILVAVTRTAARLHRGDA